jgi:hypothetical protein
MGVLSFYLYGQGNPLGNKTRPSIYGPSLGRSASPTFPCLFRYTICYTLVTDLCDLSNRFLLEIFLR